MTLQEFEITSDYTRWSDEQRKAKLSTDHSLWEQERDRAKARWDAGNAETRRQYLASLEAKKSEERRADEQQIDVELLPQKLTAMREWLAHPANAGKTEADFNKLAWTHLRANLIEQRKNDGFQSEIQSQLASGRYST